MRAIMVMALALWSLFAYAGQERYDYDPLGRLIRVIDEQGRVTEYDYDAAGNILAVRTAAQVTPPQITSVSPSTLRRGSSVRFSVLGSGMLGARVRSPDPASLALSKLTVASTQISFQLAAGVTAPLGPQSFAIENSTGTSTFSITVHPVLPQIVVEPIPLAIPPDNQSRSFSLVLSNADAIDHSVTLAMSNANAEISPTSVSFPAGATRAQAQITGRTTGQATLSVTSATLATVQVPVFIATDFIGLNTSYARALGVVVTPGTTPTSNSFGPFVSSQLGVIVGSAITGIAPNSLVIGTGPAPLTVNGFGLGAVASAVLVPPEDVTLGALVVASDGRSVSLPVTVASSAVLGLRRLVIRDGAGKAIPASTPSADRISIVRPAPVVESVEPNFGLAGATVTLVVRGKNLLDVQSVSLDPSTGIAIGTPVSNSDGSAVTVGLQIAANAALGTRTVSVTTLGGRSSAVSSPANTFIIGQQIQDNVTPIVAPTVGVVLESTQPPQTIQRDAYATVLGVSLGSVITEVTPAAGAVGSSLTLTLKGRELQTVDNLSMVPPEGLTLGARTVSPDGQTITVPVSIDSAAALTARRIRVLAGTKEIAFSPATLSQFSVTLPPPQVDAISPIVVATGQSLVPFTVVGKNLQSASEIRVIPSGGVEFSPPVPNASGTEATAILTVSAGAAIGQRAVVIVTPGGVSSSVLAPQNTLTIASQLGGTITPVIAPSLGVVFEPVPPPPTTVEIGPFAAPAVGVVLQTDTQPSTVSRDAFATQLGVAVGPVAFAVSPNGLAPGSALTLSITGVSLANVTSVTAQPGTGLTFGPLQISPDGTRIDVPLTVAIDAPAVPHTLRIGSVPFIQRAASVVTVGPGVPQVDSISPILGRQGETIALIVRGARFTGATAVTATPGDGLNISPTLSVNAAGTELTVGIAIANGASLGPRVIQVIVPGAASTTVPSPANTFTVISP